VTTRLRDVHWNDISVLADVEATLFGAHAWSEATWWAELAARPRREYVAAVADDGTLCGYAGLDQGGETADIMTVAVLPDHQGAGLGRDLLDELIHRAQARGALALMLEVRADNEPARGLYERAGFELVGRRPGYYQPDAVDALVLRRSLTTAEDQAV
jgi:ribosomal-protein-alanine N-acetyltransferase